MINIYASLHIVRDRLPPLLVLNTTHEVKNADVTSIDIYFGLC